jgi:hypothetical protein
MQPSSGESDLVLEGGRRDADGMNQVATCLKVLMDNKYSDVILLFSVICAFGLLLMFSSTG